MSERTIERLYKIMRELERAGRRDDAAAVRAAIFALESGR